MNIGFDAKRAFYNKTGLGNYSRNLIAALCQYYPQNNYQLYLPKLNHNHLFGQITKAKTVEIITNKGIWNNSLWRSFAVKSSFQKHQTQIYHGLSAELPFGKKPKQLKYVVTIHDLIYERFPELYAATDRKIYASKTKAACKVADKIIAISEQTKNDLIAFYNVPNSKIEVVYQCCDASFTITSSPDQKAKVKSKYNLPDNFLLSVGTLETRKNTKIILEALVQLPPEIKLVLVGKSTPYTAILETFIAQNNLTSRVQLIHNVSFEDLPSIYQMAQIFVYPSLFEGFGIPVIEAVLSKIPVITATGSCLEEAGGPNSLYFDPNDANTLKSHIQKLWNQAENRTIQIEKSWEFAQKFSPYQFAKDTISIYQNIIN